MEISFTRFPPIDLTKSLINTVVDLLFQYGFGRWDEIALKTLKHHPTHTLTKEQFRSLCENICSVILHRKKSTSEKKKNWKYSNDPLLVRYIKDDRRQTLTQLLRNIKVQHYTVNTLSLDLPDISVSATISFSQYPSDIELLTLRVNACHTFTILVNFPANFQCFFLIQYIPDNYNNEGLFIRQIPVTNGEVSFIAPGYRGSYKGQLYRLDRVEDSEKARLVPFGNIIKFRVSAHPEIRTDKIPHERKSLEILRYLNNIIRVHGTEMTDVKFPQIYKPSIMVVGKSST